MPLLCALQHYRTWLAALVGHKRRFIAFSLGACLTLALPPVSFFPAAIIALTSILWMQDHCTHKMSAFRLGWWFGFGHFMTGFYWISNALLVDAALFGWLIPFALFGIAAVIALYMGIIFVLLHLTRAQGIFRVILFAAVWTLVEMARGILFTGFPWNNIGYAFSFSTALLQSASIVGIWGLSFIVIIFASIPYTLGRTSHSWKATALGVCLFMLLFAAGTWRLSTATADTVTNVMLRVVQGNIPQTLKWDPTQEYQNLDKYIQLSTQESQNKITHIIWPETAIPYALNDRSEVVHTLLKPIVPEQGALISGALHVQTNALGDIEKLWNAALILPHSGPIQFYHKSHLVPFGEYIPFRAQLNAMHLPVKKITAGMMDFTSGAGPETYHLPHFVPFSPLICYEAIFPEKVANKTHRPELLINVTNDAWYGYSAGPFQHFQSARLRAIEQGVPLVRAANTGISGVVDAYGRIIRQSSLQTVAVLDSPLPVAITPPLYTFIGRIGVAAPLAILFLFSLFSNRKRHDTIALN